MALAGQIPEKHYADFFEVDGAAVALAALSSLVRKGDIEASVYQKAVKKFGVSSERTDITEL